MKRKFALFILCLLFINQSTVFAYDEITPIENTNYYFTQIDNSYYITDKDGKKLLEQAFFEVEYKGNCYIVRYMSNGEKNNNCTLLNNNFKELIPAKYSSIQYNENTKCYECLYWDKANKKNSIDFYDTAFKKVIQPTYIFPIENTDYYCQRVIDEKSNAINEFYFICDSSGKKLIDEGFKKVSGLKGNIVVTRFSDSKCGLYNKNLNLVADIKYLYINFDEESQSICLDDGNKKEYFTVDFEPKNPVKKIENTNFYLSEKENAFYFCNEKGEVVNNTKYYDINYIGNNKFAVRSSDKYPYKFSVIDDKFNILIDDYFLIEKNDYGQIKAYTNETVDIYDNNFNKINTEKSSYTFVSPISSMDRKFIYNIFVADNMGNDDYIIIDSDGNALTKPYRSISDVQMGNTFIVTNRVGMADSRTAVLNNNFKEIISDLYNAEIVQENGLIFIIGDIGQKIYCDLNGNKYNSKEELFKNNQSPNDMSDWAKDSIQKADSIGIIPQELKSLYKKNITRKEFCRLAMSMYTAKTKNKIAENVVSPFEDINDDYVTAAYNMGVVAGTGHNKFTPDNNITRQEAAVMLKNLANVLGIADTPKKDKFADESYFAVWAKNEIYSIAGIKSGNTYVMEGTGNKKFSPYMSYTREQAIATMLRLYNCDNSNQSVSQTEDKYIYSIYDDSNAKKKCLVKVNNYGGDRQVLVESDESGLMSIEKVTKDNIYYSIFEKNYRSLFMIKKDGSGKKLILDDENTGFHISDTNIYYISYDPLEQSEKPYYIVKTDLNGKNEQKAALPRDCSISSAEGNLVYLSFDIKDSSGSVSVKENYMYSFDTAKLEKI